jgi:hypothetical protein
MWRTIVLLVFLLVGVCGCLAATKRDKAHVPSATQGHMDAGVRTEELPTPQLFGIGLDLSGP